MTFFGEEDDDFKFLAVAASIHTAVVLQKGKAYSTMSKVIMGNGGFCGCLIKPQGIITWWKEIAQSMRILSFSFVPESP